MSEEIKKYDEKGNLIYWKDSYGEEWQKYDENNRIIYYKSSIDTDYGYWYMYSDLGRRIEITEQEFLEIEFRKKEQEYLSRKKVTRFELMDI